tara:strand:- start:630 stop:944 length:315 start_codon:yes stop_codon:yes gene_type:complete
MKIFTDEGLKALTESTKEFVSYVLIFCVCFLVFSFTVEGMIVFYDEVVKARANHDVWGIMVNEFAMLTFLLPWIVGYVNFKSHGVNEVKSEVEVKEEESVIEQY